MALDDPNAITVSALVGDAVICVSPQTTLYEIAEEMTNGDISALGVGTAEALLGVISERDVVRAVAARLDPASTTAMDLAKTELIWADPTATIAEVANEMMDRWVRHVLVGSPTDLLGIVSARDLLGTYAARDDSDPE